MVQCGRPAAFMYSYKPHTIKENVLCYATVVVTGTNLLKSREILTLWYSIGEPVHCMHVWSSHIAMLDQPKNKVANSARRGRMNTNSSLRLPCPHLCLRIWPCETVSAIPSRANQLILHTEVESGAYSRDPPDFRGVVQSLLLLYTIGSVPSLLGHAIDIHRVCNTLCYHP